MEKAAQGVIQGRKYEAKVWISWKSDGEVRRRKLGHIRGFQPVKRLPRLSHVDKAAAKMEELAWSELRALQRNSFLMYLDRELYGLVITKS
jgi:hypothetical protein